MRILLAVDSSAHSEMATRSVAERPWPPHSIVRVLSVAQLEGLPERPSFWDSGAAYEHLTEELLSRARAVVDRAANELRASELSVEVAVRRGDPRAEIADEIGR